MRKNEMTEIIEITTATQQGKIRPCDMTPTEKTDERDAIRAAEQSVKRQWHSAPRGLTVDSPEAKAWRAAPVQRGEHPRARAERLARENARVEFRTRLAHERAERARQMIALPAHITRMTQAETAGLKAACLDLEPVK
jgi:hypothetical protein